MRLILLVIILLFTTSAQAEPTYRLGVGVIYSQLPDYLGSASRRSYLVPFPYVSYHSDKLSIEGNEALGTLLRHNNWSLNISVGGALPVNSDENTLRRGMPDLTWIGEAGPALHYQFIEKPAYSLLFKLPVRKAVATDLTQWQSIGWRTEPQLQWHYQLSSQLQWHSQLAASWSTRQYHQYIYGVDDQYAHTDRAAYQAASGFSGWRWSNGLTWRSQQWQLAGFIRYDNLQRVSFNDSPLLEKHHNVSMGIVIAWIVKQQ